MDLVIEKIKNLNEAAISAKKNGDIAEAIQLLHSALQLEPHPTSYLNLAIIYFSQENYSSAVETFEKIKQPWPEKFAFYFYYGRALAEIQRQDLAIPFLEKSLHLDPNSLHAQAALAYCYSFMGQHEKAQPLYQALVNEVDITNNDYKECGIQLFFSLLNSQKWLQAQQIAFRLLPEKNMQIDGIAIEIWRGQSELNKSIFMISNEGVGDDLSYSIYIPQLQARFRQIFFECDARLITYLKKNYPGVYFFSKTNLLERKKALRQCQLANFSYQVACYFPIKAAMQQAGPLRAGKMKFEKFTVGISYSSTAKDAFKRMPPLDFWEALFEKFPDIDFINLQDNEKVKASAMFFLNEYPRVKKIESVDLYNDFENVAALINGCNTIISIDNSLAHLAGRLNKPCAVLLSTGADWRWSNDEFYPSVTKIQQREYGNWHTVFEELVKLIVL